MAREILKNLTPKELLQRIGEILDELKDRKIIRTRNNPLSDYTELLVSKRYGWQLAFTSKKGYDLEDLNTKRRYEVKARRISKQDRLRQVSAIRDIDGHHFDALITVIYDESYEILSVMEIPWEIVKKMGKIANHTNSITLYARNSLLKEKGVLDRTNDFKKFSL